jgi:hypothetical protein
MSTGSLRSTGSAGSTGSADAGAGAGAAGSSGELSDSLAGAFTASQLQRAYDQAVAAGVDSSALGSLAAADSRAEAEVSRRPLHIAPLEVFPTAPRAEQKLDAVAHVRPVSEAAGSVSRQGSGQEQQLQEQKQGVVDDFGGGNAPVRGIRSVLHRIPVTINCVVLVVRRRKTTRWTQRTRSANAVPTMAGLP